METRKMTDEVKAENLNIAKTIWAQILCGPRNVIWSWGISSVYAVTPLPAIAIRVNGRLFKGAVIVMYDEGRDLYNIDFTPDDPEGDKPARVTGVYCDQLVNEIDTLIEVGDNWEEYEQFCKHEQEKLTSDIINGNL